MSVSTSTTTTGTLPTDSGEIGTTRSYVVAEINDVYRRTGEADIFADGPACMIQGVRIAHVYTYRLETVRGCPFCGHDHGPGHDLWKCRQAIICPWTEKENGRSFEHASGSYRKRA